MYNMQKENSKLKNIFLIWKINLSLPSNILLPFLKKAVTYIPNITNDRLYRKHCHLSPDAEKWHFY